MGAQALGKTPQACPRLPRASLLWNQQAGSRLSVDQEVAMAVTKPTGDNARKGAVKKRTPAKKKYKGVRKER
jgi:hypothetical protein